MHKTLCVAAIALAMFALTAERSAGTPKTTLTSPLIVARGRLCPASAGNGESVPPLR